VKIEEKSNQRKAQVDLLKNQSQFLLQLINITITIDQGSYLFNLNNNNLKIWFNKTFRIQCR